MPMGGIDLQIFYRKAETMPGQGGGMVKNSGGNMHIGVGRAKTEFLQGFCYKLTEAEAVEIRLVGRGFRMKAENGKSGLGLKNTARGAERIADAEP